jgi:hypothetical protein
VLSRRRRQAWRKKGQEDRGDYFSCAGPADRRCEYFLWASDWAGPAKPQLAQPPQPPPPPPLRQRQQQPPPLPPPQGQPAAPVSRSQGNVNAPAARREAAPADQWVVGRVRRPAGRVALTVRARPGRLSGLSDFLVKLFFYGAFV